MNWLARWFRREAPHLRAGRLGEGLAEHFFKKAGCRIVARNVRVGRDELDLVVQQGPTLVFVEVKTRANERFGRPSAAVDRAKRRRISRAAVRFLKQQRLRPQFIRFDVVEVVGDPPEVRHLPNAFTLEGGYQIRW